MAYYDINGNIVINIYDINGNIVSDTPPYSNEYEQYIYNAKNEWIRYANSNSSVVPIIIHTDQHGKLTTNNKLFSYLSKIVPFNSISACIGLGDVHTCSASSFQAMQNCLKDIPKNKQINIWGNHDTWDGSRQLNETQKVASDEEFENVLSLYFDNSQYNGNVRYNKYGIETMIDEVNKIRYIVIGGWEYDPNLGGYSHYVIGNDSMNHIIDMLSCEDGYDIIILSHIQPFSKNKGKTNWIIPYEDTCGGGGLSSTNNYEVGAVVGVETTLDQMLIDRKNKASGTIRDSYKNEHNYDFTNCTSDLICCLAGHEHCNWYMHQNNNIPVLIYDAYAYDTHPFYFTNVNRDNKIIKVWRVDDTPQIIRYQIPFEKVTT